MPAIDARRLGLIAYADAWAIQREIHASRVAGEIPDTVLLLEHPDVYTAGRRTEAWERPVDGTPVVNVDRGGKITWHGPGQLVGYPILALPHPLDVVAHVRRIEGLLIDVCAEFGVEAIRVEGRSGVWTSDGHAKLAAIGIRVSNGVSLHGFAINANPDLNAYDRIVPCGLRDAAVTSLSQVLGHPVTVGEVLPLVEERLSHLLAVANV